MTAETTTYYCTVRPLVMYQCYLHTKLSRSLSVPHMDPSVEHRAPHHTCHSPMSITLQSNLPTPSQISIVHGRIPLPANGNINQGSCQLADGNICLWSQNFNYDWCSTHYTPWLCHDTFPFILVPLFKFKDLGLDFSSRFPRLGQEAERLGLLALGESA